MRHLKKGRKFSRTRNQRKALMRTLAFQLIMRGRIATSAAKAKEMRPAIEKLITVAKSGTLASRRLLASRLPESAAKKLFNEIAPHFKDRRGGYTRIIRTGERASDASRQAIIEFVQ